MKNPILIKFGEVIKELRVKKGISQEELGKRAKLHRTYIGMIERAEKNVTLENITKLCKALEIPLSKLFEKIEND